MPEDEPDLKRHITVTQDGEGRIDLAGNGWTLTAISSGARVMASPSGDGGVEVRPERGFVGSDKVIGTLMHDDGRLTTVTVWVEVTPGKPESPTGKFVLFTAYANRKVWWGGFGHDGQSSTEPLSLTHVKEWAAKMTREQVASARDSWPALKRYQEEPA